MACGLLSGGFAAFGATKHIPYNSTRFLPLQQPLHEHVTSCGNERRKTIALVWMHAPKSGSSFANTLFHFGCPGADSTLQVDEYHQDAPVWPPQPLAQHWNASSCIPAGSARGWSPLQVTSSRRDVHAPVQLADAGKIVALFRAPSRRLSSCLHNTFNSFNEKSSRTSCDNQSFDSMFAFLATHGWDAPDIVHAWVGHNCSTPWAYLRSPSVSSRMLGVQSKLVLGLPAGTPVHSSAFHERWSWLADGTNPNFLRFYSGLRLFAFVGVTEQWAESICLFHRLFGAPVLPQELLNSRPTPDKPLLVDGAQLSRFVESHLPDPYDTFLYSKVLDRFRRDLDLYRIPLSDYR